MDFMNSYYTPDTGEWRRGREFEGPPHRLYWSGPAAGGALIPSYRKGAQRMAVKDQEPTILTQETKPSPADSVYKEDALETMAEARQRWETARSKSEAQIPFWKKDFTTVSGMEVPPLVTLEQVADVDP